MAPGVTGVYPSLFSVCCPTFLFGLFLVGQFQIRSTKISSSTWRSSGYVLCLDGLTARKLIFFFLKKKSSSHSSTISLAKLPMNRGPSLCTTCYLQFSRLLSLVSSISLYPRDSWIDTHNSIFSVSATHSLPRRHFGSGLATHCITALWVVFSQHCYRVAKFTCSCCLGFRSFFSGVTWRSETDSTLGIGTGEPPSILLFCWPCWVKPHLYQSKQSCLTLFAWSPKSPRCLAYGRSILWLVWASVVMLLFSILTSLCSYTGFFCFHHAIPSPLRYNCSCDRLLERIWRHRASIVDWWCFLLRSSVNSARLSCARLRLEIVSVS